MWSEELKDTVWRRVYESVLAQIQRGEFDDSEKIPSESALMRRFGVSRATVGRVMQELVHANIVERRKGSGSFLTPTARNATGKIAILAPGYSRVEIMKPIADAARAAAEAMGYEVLLKTVDSLDPNVYASQTRSHARSIVAGKVAGVVLEPLELVPNSVSLTAEIIGMFRDAGISVVLVDRDAVAPPARSGFDIACLNNYRCGERIGHHVVAAGARRIAFVMQPDCAPTLGGRASGAIAAARLAGATVQIIREQPDDVDAMRTALLKRRRPDAVMCGNDRTAAAMLKTLTSLGLRVPQDILLSGFDDVEIAPRLDLTTVRQPCSDIGRAAVTLLLTRLAHPEAPPREFCLDATLIVRGSTSRR